MIQEICSISGAAGVSIGVVHHREVVYNKSLGFRDIEGRVGGDSDTIYRLGSTTNGFTAQAMGILVEEEVDNSHQSHCSRISP